VKASVRLQPHQADAVAKSQTNKGQILNWGLGSGKTLGAIAIAEKRGGNVLVVTPASLRQNFEKQLRQFVPKSRVGAYTIMSYEKFRRDPEAVIAQTRPNVLVVDEMHRLRNPKPREPFDRVRDSVPYMVGLTGSLINNRPEEMVPMINMVAGSKPMGSIEDFKRDHIKRTKVGPGFIGWLRGVKPGFVEDIKNRRLLKLKAGANVHRFTGSQEYKQHLPTVVEDRVEVEMTKKQEALYKSLSTKNPALAYKMKKNLPPSKKDLKQMNAFMTASRQIMNNPSEYTLKEKPPVIAGSPKFQTMVDKLEAGHKADPRFKAVIYSNFLKSGVEPMVEELNRRGVRAEAFTGKLNDKQRKKMVEDMNRGRIKVLGLSPAGGEGLDLKGVKVVNLTEEHWNPERGLQAIGRSARYKSHAHLPAGERQVNVNRYMAVHRPTFANKYLRTKKDMSADQWIDERRSEKLRLNNKFLDAIGQFEDVKTAGLASGMEKEAAGGKSRVLLGFHAQLLSEAAKKLVKSREQMAQDMKEHKDYKTKAGTEMLGRGMDLQRKKRVQKILSPKNKDRPVVDAKF
jgi:superfamily II DNA or RNA helicase